MLSFSASSTLLLLLLLFSLLISGSPSFFGVLSSMSSMISPLDQHEGEISMGTQSALEILALATNHLTDGIRSIDQPHRPFITISYAQTIDGSIAPTSRSRLDISSPLSFSLLHSLRARHDAVLVGINTVLVDDPQLNVREPLPGVAHARPRPVIVDSDLKILDYPCARLRFKSPIVCTCLTPDSERWQRAAIDLRAINGTLLSCKRNPEGRCDLDDCFALLKDQSQVESMLVEGGAGIIQSVLESGLVDQLVVTIRPSLLGGYRSLTRELLQPVDLSHTHAASVGGDIVLYSRVQQKILQRRQNECTDSSSSSIEDTPPAPPPGGNRTAVVMIVP